MSASEVEIRPSTRLSRWLATAPAAAFTFYAIAASFSTYFCMYAFRRPFAAGTFEGDEIFGLDAKIAFIISQVLGYALSKFVGIKFCSEIRPARRAIALVMLILVAEAALVLFGILPRSLRTLAMFLNGIPLGMVWGLVFSFLEGRKTSDILGAGLSCSFIVSSGVVKAVGSWFVLLGVSEFWMPALTGVCFLPFFLLSVWFLKQIPPPSNADVSARAKRDPMDGKDRLAFIRQFAPGMILLVVLYFFLTAYRDYRDSFQKDILDELGRAGSPELLALTELPVAFIVMAAMALLYIVKDNRVGLIATHVLMGFGALLVGGSTVLVDLGTIGGVWWIILTGIGAYLAYVPFGCVLFDRIIAHTRAVGTAVFAIYIADAIGYSGSISVLLYKNVAGAGGSERDFFHDFSYFTAALCTLCFIGSCVYFVGRGAMTRDSSE